MLSIGILYICRSGQWLPSETGGWVKVDDADVIVPADPSDQAQLASTQVRNADKIARGRWLSLRAVAKIQLELTHGNTLQGSDEGREKQVRALLVLSIVSWRESQLVDWRLVWVCKV